MSGAPWREGVDRSRAALERMAELSKVMRDQQRVMAEAKQSIEAAMNEYSKLSNEIDDLLKAMDLTANHNNGFEQRRREYLLMLVDAERGRKTQ